MTKKNQQKSNKTDEPNYEQIGRMLVTIYETGYIRTGRMIKLSIVRGVATGFGTVIGATLVVAIALWLLSIFSGVPIFGPLLDSLREPIKSGT